MVKAEVEILERNDGEKGKVVILGFSQGAAVASVLLLSGELERAGISSGLLGVVGMSGWLPLRAQIQECIRDNSHIYDTVDQGVRAKRIKTREYLRGYLELDDCEEGVGEVVGRGDNHDNVIDIPIFLGHGKVDEKVKLEWASQMADVLLELGLNVQRKAYDGLAHWWNEEEIAEVARFVNKVWGGDAGSPEVEALSTL